MFSLSRNGIFVLAEQCGLLEPVRVGAGTDSALAAARSLVPQ